MSEEGMMTDIKIITPPVKRINLGGEIVEVAFIPARISLEAAQISEGMSKGSISEYEGSDKLIDLIEKICQKSNPIITREWLLDNTSLPMLLEFMDFAIGGGEDAVKTTQKGKSGKN